MECDSKDIFLVPQKIIVWNRLLDYLGIYSIITSHLPQQIVNEIDIIDVGP